MSEFYEYDKALSKINDLEHENFLLKARIAELEAQLAEALPYLINEKIRKGQFEEVN